MRSTIALSLLILSISPALADCGNVTMPPPQYDKPLPYDPTIRLLDYYEVDGYCRAHGLLDPGRVEACNSGHTMVLPKVGHGITLERQRCLFRHERAHMAPNNWPGDHPGARFEP